jgi:hypothetical protein
MPVPARSAAVGLRFLAPELDQRPIFDQQRHAHAEGFAAWPLTDGDRDQQLFAAIRHGFLAYIPI